MCKVTGGRATPCAHKEPVLCRSATSLSPPSEAPSRRDSAWPPHRALQPGAGRRRGPQVFSDRRWHHSGCGTSWNTLGGSGPVGSGCAVLHVCISPFSSPVGWTSLLPRGRKPTASFCRPWQLASGSGTPIPFSCSPSPVWWTRADRRAPSHKRPHLHRRGCVLAGRPSSTFGAFLSQVTSESLGCSQLGGSCRGLWGCLSSGWGRIAEGSFSHSWFILHRAP